VAEKAYDIIERGGELGILLPTNKRPSDIVRMKGRWIVALHEAGHYIVGWNLAPPADRGGGLLKAWILDTGGGQADPPQLSGMAEAIMIAAGAAAGQLADRIQPPARQCPPVKVLSTAIGPEIHGELAAGHAIA